MNEKDLKLFLDWLEVRELHYDVTAQLNRKNSNLFSYYTGMEAAYKSARKMLRNIMDIEQSVVEVDADAPKEVKAASVAVGQVAAPAPTPAPEMDVNYGEGYWDMRLRTIPWKQLHTGYLAYPSDHAQANAGRTKTHLMYSDGSLYCNPARLDPERKAYMVSARINMGVIECARCKGFAKKLAESLSHEERVRFIIQ